MSKQCSSCKKILSCRQSLWRHRKNCRSPSTQRLNCDADIQASLSVSHAAGQKRSLDSPLLLDGTKSRPSKNPRIEALANEIINDGIPTTTTGRNFTEDESESVQESGRVSTLPLFPIPPVSDSDQVRENHPKKSKVATPLESRSQRSELSKNPKIQTLVNEINNDKAEVLSSTLPPKVTHDIVEAASSECEPLQEVVVSGIKTETCNDERKDADIDKRNDNKMNGEKREACKRAFKRVWKEKVKSTLKNTIDPLVVHEKEELMKLIEDFKENDSHINAILKIEKSVNEFLKWETWKLNMDELVKELESFSLPKDKIAKLKTLINNIHDKRYHFFRSFFLQEQVKILNVLNVLNAMRQNTTSQNTRDEETDGTAIA